MDETRCAETVEVKSVSWIRTKSMSKKQVVVQAYVGLKSGEWCRRVK